jgi:hypothetical protein
LAFVAYLKATYQDGFVLEEDERDQSPYDEGRNIFHAIANSRPCIEHGRLVEFALITPDGSHVVDWTDVPEGARPVRERHMQMQQVGEVLGAPTVMQIVFGYEYDRDGEVVREITEVL